MDTESNIIERERTEILERYERWFETPLVVLGFVWLILLVLEFTRGLTPFFEAFSTIIWIIFILDFLIRFAVAPHKLRFLKSNILTAISLAVPALRIFRFARAIRMLRAARAARGMRLLRVVTSVNRGMGALGAVMGRRGFGYVMALTLLITLAGAAGMYAFENEADSGLRTYGAALWWTAMIMTTMGSEYWPKTAEGRLLCVLLALYAFAVFGYVTAAIASYFVGRDADTIKKENNIETLRREIELLRAEVQNSRSRQ